MSVKSRCTRTALQSSIELLRSVFSSPFSLNPKFPKTRPLWPLRPSKESRPLHPSLLGACVRSWGMEKPLPLLVLDPVAGSWAVATPSLGLCGAAGRCVLTLIFPPQWTTSTTSTSRSKWGIAAHKVLWFSGSLSLPRLWSSQHYAPQLGLCVCVPS